MQLPARRRRRIAAIVPVLAHLAVDGGRKWQIQILGVQEGALRHIVDAGNGLPWGQHADDTIIAGIESDLLADRIGMRKDLVGKRAAQNHHIGTLSIIRLRPGTA